MTDISRVSQNIDVVNNFASVYSVASTYGQGFLRKHNNGEGLIATLKRSVRGVSEDKSHSFLETYVGNHVNGFMKVSSCPLSTPLGSCQPAIYDISPSGKTIFTAYNSADISDSKTLVEVTGDEIESFRIDASTFHGSIVGDSWFGSSSWSVDENYVAYIASEHTKKQSTGKSHLEEGGVEEGRYKFEYEEDWGERFTGTSRLAIFVLDIKEQTIKKVTGVDSHALTVGKVSFIPPIKGNSENRKLQLAYTAWNNEPRKLGIFSCYQRPSAIYLVDVSELLSTPSSEPVLLTHRLLSKGIALAKAPRGSPDGKFLVFLGNRKGFLSHNGCSELFRVDLTDPDSHPVTVVEEVRNCAHSSVNGRTKLSFPGLYSDNIPESCFTTDGRTLILNSVWGSQLCVLAINIETKKVDQLVFHPEEGSERGPIQHGSTAALDVSGDQVLYTFSTPVSPPQVRLASLTTGVRTTIVDSVKHSIRTVINPTKPTKPLTCSSLGLEYLYWRWFPHVTDGIPFDSFLIYPSEAAKKSSLPLVVVPHGGPHSCSTTSFIPSYAFLALQLNAVVLHVNYRGSTGFGQDSVESLLSRIGTQDLADLMTTVHHAESLLVDTNSGELLTGSEGKGRKLVNPGRVSVVGGSHGGFLAGHCIGQHPEKFKVACMRNPVTNIAGMVSVSDIPDWCHVESVGVVNTRPDIFPTSFPSNDRTSADIDWRIPPAGPEQLEQMYKSSPVAHIKAVRAPTLLCLGGKDRRVPPSQGIEYFHLLKAYGVPTRMLMFPEDRHSLDKPATEAEHWVSIALWIMQYLPQE